MSLGIKTFLVSLFILFIMRRLVTRHAKRSHLRQRRNNAHAACAVPVPACYKSCGLPPFLIRTAMLICSRLPLRLSAFRRSLALALVAGPLLCFGLGACSSTDEDAYVERPPEQIYEEALKSMEEKEYKKAAKQFDEVERQHPYSQWASRAQVMAAYAHYQGLKFDDAILALDRYIQLHPGGDQAPYAYYLKALCYYEQISDVGRDQKITLLALATLKEVRRRFPETGYARDAKLKIDLTEDHLAGKEMEVGRFYQRQQNFMAAASRFRKVIDTYQTTSHTAEALHRLVETYLSLGLINEARQTAAVLGNNFPGSPWYEDSYELLTDSSIPPVKTGAQAPSTEPNGGSRIAAAPGTRCSGPEQSGLPSCSSP